MKTRSILLLLALIVAAGAVLYGLKEYGRGHKDTAGLAAVHSISAADLLAAFQRDEAAATTKYVGGAEQVIEVAGAIREVERPSAGIVNVILDTGDDMSGVVCEFTDGTVPAHWTPGTEVKLKGICTGMLLDIVLVRCVPSN